MKKLENIVVNLRPFPLKIISSNFKLIEEIESLKSEIETQLYETKKERDLSYKEGFKHGEEKGVAKAFDYLISIVEKQKEDGIKFKEEIEEKLPLLATELVKKIIQRELKIDQNTIIEITKNLLLKTGFSPSIDILIHPSNLPVFEKNKELLCGNVENSIINIVVDENLEKEDVIIKTEKVKLDGRLSILQKQIMESLKEV
jgi:flagellar assembly protein FliH